MYTLHTHILANDMEWLRLEAMRVNTGGRITEFMNPYRELYRLVVCIDFTPGV